MSDRLLIIGSGALACLFGARLARSGAAVTLTGTWEAGLEAIRDSGIGLVESHNNSPEFHSVEILDTNASPKTFDRALLLTKTYQTVSALERVKSHLADDCRVLSLQNGLTAKQLMMECLDESQIITGITTCGAEMIAPGICRHNGGVSVQVENIPAAGFFKTIFSMAGFAVDLVPDIHRAVWIKAILNSAANPIGALSRMRNGEILTKPELMLIMDDLIKEACAVARSDGVEVDPVELQDRLRSVMKKTVNNRCSMLQDVLTGRSTEIEEINGAITSLASRKAIAVPVQITITRLMRSIGKEEKSYEGC